MWSRLLYWSIPSLLFLALYWYGLKTKYFRDDFAWLNLASGVEDWPSFLRAMFEPYAQGTVRPLSERLFFLFGWKFFGLDALPLRVIVFGTQIVNLLLLSALTRRLTGSAIAGFLAPVLWVVNANIYYPLTWTSAYNQILCAAFLLGAMYSFVRFTQEGGRRWYVLQGVLFVLGLGALELMVVYPVLAALYALCCSRQHLKATIPLICVSIVYAVAHRMLAPSTSEVYRMYFDGSIAVTLAQYVLWTTGAGRYSDFVGMDPRPFYAVQLIVLVALLTFAGWMALKRRWLAVFLLGWFFVALTPFLPLRNHVEDYYLTTPLIGWAMLGAWGIAEAMPRRKYVIVLVLVYALPSAWAARGMNQHYVAISRRVDTFLASLAYAHKLHPDKAIRVRGIDNELYWSAWHDAPFPLLGIRQAYLAPDAEKRVDTPPAPGIRRRILPDAVALEALKTGRLVSYSVLPGDRLLNETRLVRIALDGLPGLRAPEYLDAGAPLFAPFFARGWSAPENGFRWAEGTGVVKMHGTGTLLIRGFGSSMPAVRLNGLPAAVRELQRSGEHFRLEIPAPAGAVEVTLESARRVAVASFEMVR